MTPMIKYLKPFIIGMIKHLTKNKNIKAEISEKNLFKIRSIFDTNLGATFARSDKIFKAEND